MAINPNDKFGKGVYAKRQYMDVNQHLMHHHAVLPVLSTTPEIKSREGLKSPIKDPYSGMPEKPNRLTGANVEQLQA